MAAGRRIHFTPMFWKALVKVGVLGPVFLSLWLFGWLVRVLPYLMVLFFVILIWSFFSGRKPYAGDFSDQTTDPQYYEDFRPILCEPALSILPAKLPQETGKVIRYSAYFHHFMDGSGHVQLRMKLEKCECAKLDAEYGKKPFVRVEKYGDFSGGKWSAPYFETADIINDCTPFPDDYHFWVYDGPNQTGRTIGIALSPTRNEIVYWVCW